MIPEELQKEFLDKFPLKYDIRVFELFPIDIKISVINIYRVIFGNTLEISEYFYLFGKSKRIVNIVSYQTNF
ncbi:MAG: hypothetical protein EAX89_11970 [Candidatus Lokiarchaeota archaeon]|nr:hypothetical protein [Candidatus Lokiarchaeota archaeon]